MVQQIKHLSDLPKWFSLDKYSEAVNLDALGWCEQLSWRLGMLKALCRPYSNDIWKIDEPSQNISKNRTQALYVSCNCSRRSFGTKSPVDFSGKKEHKIQTSNHIIYANTIQIPIR